MSKGILIFAQVGDFDYITLAEIAAARVKQYLNIPVSVVTNVNYQNKSKIFDKVINKVSKSTQKRALYDGVNADTIEWMNFDRSDCYNLSPYDETIVIDADYLVSSDHLLNCFNFNRDFLIFNDHFYLHDDLYAKEFEFINDSGINFYWATVFYFKKTSYTRVLFNFIQYIRDNWEYFSLLYNIKERKFRNDFAFSIAINILSLQIPSNLFGFIPGKLFYSIDKDTLIKSENNELTFYMLSSNSCTKTKDIDIHVMNKNSILRCFND
jgi:hypothetical protein